MNIAELIRVKSQELDEIFQAHATGEKDERGMPLFKSDTPIEEINKRNAELAELQEKLNASDAIAKQYNDLQEMRKGLSEPVNSLAPQHRQNAKSLGRQFVESSQFKGYDPASYGHVSMKAADYDFKTTMTTSAGFAPANDRSNIVVMSAQRPVIVTDLIPQTNTANSSVSWMLETTYTNNAAAREENAVFGESAIAFTEQTTALRSISHFLPVTNEQLRDVAQIESVINNRLVYGLQVKEETYCLTGTGVSPQMTGFLNVSGIQTQALGADPAPDAIYKALVKVRFTGFANPTGVVINPNNWQPIRLLRTTDGIYIWGSPSEAGPATIWGLPVIETTAITAGTALVGDFKMYSELFRNQGITVEAGLVGDDFKYNRKSIRANMSSALVCYRPTAFCTVTGLA